MAKVIALADEKIVNKIYMIRDQKVMIDRDLAELYGVETKRLKEAVRRNMNRFPPDFMFEMNPKEFEDWRTQNASSKEDKKGLRYHQDAGNAVDSQGCPYKTRADRENPASAGYPDE
jgi:hypothetical protein